jgi:hypothetical protein
MTHRACLGPMAMGLVRWMKSSDIPAEPSESAPTLARGRAPSPVAPGERRGIADRRARVWWAVLYGSFNPRRRRPPRRLAESRYHSLDWHDAHLLAVSIGILLLSVADAFLTVTLLSGGAVEVNPVMAAVVYQSAAAFAVVKLTLTGGGVMLMVMLARYRFMRVIRVDAVMYGLLVVYSVLLSYEFWMLRHMPVPLEM